MDSRILSSGLSLRGYGRLGSNYSVGSWSVYRRVFGEYVSVVDDYTGVGFGFVLGAPANLVNLSDVHCALILSVGEFEAGSLSPALDENDEHYLDESDIRKTYSTFRMNEDSCFGRLCNTAVQLS